MRYLFGHLSLLCFNLRAIYTWMLGYIFAIKLFCMCMHVFGIGITGTGALEMEWEWRGPYPPEFFSK